MLRHLPQTTDENLLVGLDTADDAGVYRLRHDLALVQTVDFFTPIVDEPYHFGRIGAANALSDIYAMGAAPLTALNVVGFPTSKLDPGILVEILKGGADAVAEAQATLLGGHSIDSPEPVYGLSVTGTVHPDHIWRNHGARDGDVLVLTKPIGIGAVTTGIKNGLTPPDVAAAAIQVMSRLNRDAYEAGLLVRIHAATDVTGYGLLGHALELASGAQGGLRIELNQVPVLDGARELIAHGCYPGGTKKNLTAARGGVRFDPAVGENDQILLADAVTSGGLLLAVPESDAARLVSELERRGALAAAVIGQVTSEVPAGTIQVVP